MTFYSSTRQRILKLIYKINYMKKLITNMIAGVDEKLIKNNNFYPFLIKHKQQVTRKTIENAIRENESSRNSRKK